MFKKKAFWIIFITLSFTVWIILTHNDSVKKEENWKLQAINNKTWISVNEIADRAFRVIITFNNKDFSIFMWDYEKDIKAAEGVFFIKKDKLIFSKKYFNINLLDKIFNYEYMWENKYEEIDYSCNYGEFIIFGKSFNKMAFTNIDTVFLDYYETKHFKIFCQNESLNTIKGIVSTLYKAMSEAEQFFSIDCRKRIVNVFVYKNEDDILQEYFKISGSAFNWWLGGFVSVEGIHVISPLSRSVNYEEALIAIVHEYVHTVVNEIAHHNIYYLIEEGIAVYLSEKTGSLSQYGLQILLDYDNNDMYKLFYTGSIGIFIELYGYLYAGKFIEYVYNFYGKNKVLELLKNNNYEKVLEKDIETIFNEWKDYLRKKY
jgi:hypothetical protein